ncbi:hypothetical protein [Actinokineospora bangkokensis]|uniref:Uncharacterized protein n=1 Tax=Actinokineospora bangkokensis TaxID=1193682 RepID=A0A1Q9LG49_9PSEU|nr:hypothetical protein [Actinokineospora bangkokensis]OLR91018.1 hypothetical protein BJP25_31230 [Actinokineospora bangkokensis]
MRKRRVLCSTILGGIAASAAVLGAAPASADPLPFIALSCKQNVVGFKGQPIVVPRLAVNGMLAKAIADTPQLGLLQATTTSLTFPLGPGITVGTIPDGTGEVSAQVIADAIVAVVAPMADIRRAPDPVVASVRDQVLRGCGLSVKALDASKPTTPPSTTPAPGTTTPPQVGQPNQPAPGTPVGSASPLPPVRLYPPQQAPAGSTGTAPPRDYGGIPYASAGVYQPTAAVAGIPGYAPQFGILGQDDQQAVENTAGRAEALPGAGYARSGGVGAPILLAALFLSVVAGALVRTWVLRRS